jgi:hypothetical protein
MCTCKEGVNIGCGKLIDYYLLFYVPLKNFSLILRHQPVILLAYAWRSESLSCHICYCLDMGHQLFQSHPKDQVLDSGHSPPFQKFLDPPMVSKKY